MSDMHLASTDEAQAPDEEVEEAPLRDPLREILESVAVDGMVSIDFALLVAEDAATEAYRQATAGDEVADE